MTSADGSSCATACYVYNALDQRVEKQTGTSYLEYLYNPSGIEVEANPRQTWFNWHYLFLGGRRFGKYSSNVTYFIHQDNLGSATTMTDYTGSVQTDQLFYPWGQKWSQMGTDTETRFASLHRRDSETNLDPTHFRLFSSDQGRWFSPDPKHRRSRNPQTLNRYGYVGGDPSSKTDPSGLCGCYAQYDGGSGYDGRCGCNAGSCGGTSGGGTSGGGTSDGSSDPPQGTIHVRRQIDPPPSNNCAAGILICGYAYYNCVNNAINVLLWCINTECYGTNGPCTTGNTFWCDACISGCSYFEGTLLYGCAVSWRACIKSYCG